MQGGYNLFFLSICSKIYKQEIELKKRINPNTDEYDNGYLQGLKDAHKLALEIRHSEDYFE